MISAESLRSKYDDLIKEAILRAKPDLDVTRADDVDIPGVITNDILKRLMTSDYVVADITFPNPNVFYELGLRHACKIGTILIKEKSDVPLPFDIAHSRYIEYDNTGTGLKKLSLRLKKQFEWFENNKNIPDNQFIELANHITKNLLDSKAEPSPKITMEDTNHNNISNFKDFHKNVSRQKTLSLLKKDKTSSSLAERVRSANTPTSGTVYEGDITYIGTDLHDIIGLDDEMYIEINATNFKGFISQEKLKIYGGSFVDDRNIKKGGLVYETRIEQIDFKSDAWEDTYNVMELFGDVYVPLKNSTPNKLTKLLLDTRDKYTLRLGSELKLADGYELTAKQIDVSGDRVWMELSKDGEFIEDEVIHVDNKTDRTWIYYTDIADEINVEVFRVNVTKLFQGQVDSLVVVEGIWLIDYENILELEVGDEFDILKVDRIVDSSMIMVNEDPILLTRNSIQEIAEGMKLKVTDSDDLAFKLIREYV
ncbi:S-layer family duplication domain-containing protein [Methanolobus vulcani]|uniref:S-layer family duplication domain-containing protein n=2 Tax=Methanolobus vulcani TaxID=38026 RepID=A0A7Z7FBJ0_9EURY|nr:S-layer family duplication domain-containing protein [Methanolobus vulcani]